MIQHNSTPRYPYALEGDELGQRVYDNLRTPIESTIHNSPLSETSQTRLERAEAWLAARSMARTELNADTIQTESQLGRIVIEDLALPVFENTEETSDEIIELR